MDFRDCLVRDVERYNTTEEALRAIGPQSIFTRQPGDTVSVVLASAYAMCGFYPLETQFEDVILSIQASEFHYCHPKQGMLDPREYSQFEVAIMRREGGGFLQGEDLLPNYTAQNPLNRMGQGVLREFTDRSDDVFGYMPWQLVQQLCDTLKLTGNYVRRGQGDVVKCWTPPPPPKNRFDLIIT